MNSEILSFFPVPYPDDLLYSLWARYIYYTPKQGLLHHKEELFNSGFIKPVFKFGCNLEAFCEKINYLYTPEELLQNYTLYPYFSPFISRRRQENAFNSARFKGNSFLSSIGAKNLNEDRFRIRWCYSCSLEDHKKWGECYLHRSHQMDGIDICPKHKTGLLDYTPDSEFSYRNSYLYFNPDLSKEYELRKAEPYEERLALIAQELMELSFHQFNIEDILKMLRALFIEEGLATRKLLKYQKIYQRITEIYPEDFLKKNHLYIEDLKKKNWIRDFMIRKVVISPLEGIILISLVSDSLEDFIKNSQQKLSEMETFADFNTCHNPFCKNYQKPGARKVSVDSKGQQAIYRCECGQIYRQFRDSPDHYSIVQLGQLYGQEITRLRDSGLSFEKIGKICNTSSSGARKQLRRNNYIPVDTKIKFYQEQILAELKNNPEISRAEIHRKFNPAANYLSFYDPDFFKSLGIPFEKYKFEGGCFKDLDQKDHYYSQQVESIARELYQQIPLVMVSQKRIIEKLTPAICSSVVKNLKTTAELIKENAETQHEFGVRKLIFKIKTYQELHPEFEITRDNLKEKLKVSQRDLNLYWSDLVTNFTI